jgi:cyclopropane fatty-acyl-phospholipid synthase-like methyltransferase
MPVPQIFPKPKDYDVELKLCTDVLKLKSLHYGYWKGIKNVSVKNLKKAQDAYTYKLIDMIPAGVKTVLDVGAGIGDTAIKLVDKGYNVTSLTPEPTQVQIISELGKTYKNISVIKSKYEDFDIDKKFDLILMSESSNYFPLIKGMKQSIKFIKRGGYLLVAGLFRKKQTKIFKTWNIIHEWEQQAKNNGLNLLYKEDITDDTAPSMQLAYDFFKDYAEPAIQILSDYYKKAFKWKAFIISLFFKKELKLVKYILEDDLQYRLDVGQFKKHGRYLIYLFQKK